MAAGAGVTLDTITIEIESSAKQANDNLVNLTKTLAKLKEAISGGFNNLKTLAEGLEMLNTASKQIPKTVERLSGIAEIKKILNSLSNIKKPLGLTSAIKNIEKIPEVFARINTSTLENVARVSNELSVALTPLANKMAEIGYGFSKMQMMADRYGISVTKIREKMRSTDKETNKFEKGLRKLARQYAAAKRASDNFGRAGIKTFDKLSSKIKQVGLSLLGTRTLFTAVRKAVSEYMQLDEELAKATQNLWRALGAQLAPAIEYVLFLFEHIIRVIYSVVYALTGIDLIARANAKALKSMGKAAKDALGNLQKFDDLNTVEFDKGSGEDNLIKLEKIDLTPIKSLIEWMQKLKKVISTAIDTGDWAPVFETLKDGILDFIEWIPWHEVGTALHDSLMKIDWKAFWEGAWDVLTAMFKGLSEFLNGLFGQDEDSDFGGNVLVSLLAIYGLIQLIKGTMGLGGLFETLGLISKAPSFAKIASLFGGILVIVLSIKEGLDSWVDFFKNPSWDTGWDAFFDTLLTVAGVIGGIALLFGAWPVALIAAITMIVILIGKFLYENLEQINQWAYDVGVEIGNFFKGIEKDTKTAAGLFTKIWSGEFDKLTEDEKQMGNKILATLESMLNKMISGLNWFVRQINKIKFDVPDWVPVIGGQKWGFNIKEMSSVSLPRLETGTNEIPYEGLYHLHPGEAVVPKKYNPALGNGTDEEVGQKLDTLIGIMNNMEFTNIVNIGNKTLYKEQQKYNSFQNDKYGTTVNL